MTFYGIFGQFGLTLIQYILKIIPKSELNPENAQVGYIVHSYF
jgi:hypothetical protein